MTVYTVPFTPSLRRIAQLDPNPFKTFVVFTASTEGFADIRLAPLEPALYDAEELWLPLGIIALSKKEGRTVPDCFPFDISVLDFLGKIAEMLRTGPLPQGETAFFRITADGLVPAQELNRKN